MQIRKHLIIASMGPRVFTRGNIFGEGTALQVVIASMGPRVFTRGNSRSRVSPEPARVCFNGATRLHAWKRPRLALTEETTTPLQRGHASSRVETSNDRG